MARKLLARWQGGVVACLLLGALLLPVLTTVNFLPADEKSKAILPADLAKIPSDGMLLFSIRVADLWSGDLLKSVRGKEEIQQAAQEFEKYFGLPPEQVERLTLTIVGPPSVSREPVFVLQTVKPYKLANVLASNAKLKTEKYKGETLYVSDSWTIYPLDDRRLAYSEVSSELRNWIDHPQPKEHGALANALESAARKHSMVFGVNAKQYYESSDSNPLPPNAEPFRPLFLAHWGTLVVDVGAESRLEATLHFTQEKDANAAVKTAESGLELLRTSLNQSIQTLGKSKEMADLVSLLKQLETPLEATKIERKDGTLRASVQAKVDLDAAGLQLVQGLKNTREKRVRIESEVNLHNIGVAMQYYADTVGRLPAHAIYDKNGKPLLSWRVLLLPYIQQQALYNEFHLNEPWDSEHNKKLLARMPKVYASPQDEKTLKEHTTYYQGFFGKSAFFEGKQGIRFPADLPDGTSNTFMIVEASKAVPWTKPEDLPYDPNKPLPKLGLPGATGFLAGMCDGSIHFISHKLSEKTLHLLIQRDDGIPIPEDF